MVAFLRLRAQSEARLSRMPKLQEELRWSLPALRNYCQKQLLEKLEESTIPLEELQEFRIDCSLKDYRVELEISREGERLNLNQASQEELEALFEEAGIPPERAAVMAESLLDWRDPDNEHRLNGAEKDFYAPKGYAPRNAPLASLEEVTLIRGFDPYLFWFSPGLWQKVTIYTTSPKQAVYRAVFWIRYHGRTWCYLEIWKGLGPGGKILHPFTLLPLSPSL